MKLTIENLHKIEGQILTGPVYVWQVVNVSGNGVCYCIKIHLVEKKIPFKTPPTKIEWYLDRKSNANGEWKLYNLYGRLHSLALGSETLNRMDKFLGILNWELQKIG